MKNSPPKGKKSVHSIFFNNTDSQQSLYLKEILTKLLKKEWKGFNGWIKAWQKQRGYSKFRNA